MRRLALWIKWHRSLFSVSLFCVGIWQLELPGWMWTWAVDYLDRRYEK